MRKRIQKSLVIVASICLGTVLGQPTVSFSQEESPTVTWGKDLFANHCAVCHGQEGKGNGPMAATLKKPPADLTQISKKHGGTFPQARIRQFIDGERPVPAHGPREMPIWGREFRRDRRDTEARMRIFALASFIESIQE